MDGQSLEGPNDILAAFADLFSSVFIPSTDPPNLNNIHYNLNSNIVLELFNEQEVLLALKESKNKLTAGVDGVPSFLLRDCASVLVKPLLHLFNTSLKSQTFPDKWKMAKLCPVFKSGDASLINNYRPISILSNFSKVFERCIYKRIFASISQLIAVSQHGFFPGRSTVTNLSCLLQYAYSELNSKHQVDIIYTDFSKAFDRLDHGIVALKMNMLGFHPSLIKFFLSYLSNRFQIVEYNGHQSRQFTASSGAPQGSNLAPLIFSIFVNDIVANIDSRILLFADDMKIFRTVSNTSDCEKLQHDIDRVFEWCALNRLPLNIKKCKKISITLNKLEIRYDYNINLTLLENCEHVEDLGIIIDKKLSFNKHIDKVVKTSLKTLGFLIRSSTSFKNTHTLSLLFSSLVKSRLNYAAIVWSPSYNNSITRIESVQRRFLKYLSFREDGFYPPRGIDHTLLLNRFKFLSLHNTRLGDSVIFLYKLCNNVIDCSELLEQLRFLIPSFGTRKPDQFYLFTPSTNVVKKAPLYQASLIFNHIRTRTDLDLFSLSLGSFKKRVREYTYSLQH